MHMGTSTSLFQEMSRYLRLWADLRVAGKSAYLVVGDVQGHDIGQIRQTVWKELDLVVTEVDTSQVGEGRKIKGMVTQQDPTIYRIRVVPHLR